MIFILAIPLIIIGVYATLLSFGKIDRPTQWKNREEPLWLGRFAFLLGILIFLDGIGITPQQISSWLQDILTSGGGGGAG